MPTDQERRKILNEYLEKWPIEKLKSLTLEEYAVGNDNYKDTLSYWWETPTNILGGIGGLGGGGAFKYGVYFMTNVKDYSVHKIFNSNGRYAWRRKLGNSPEEAFVNIKSKIIEIAEAAQNRNFTKIDNIDFSYNPLKWKIAFLYSNESLLVNYQVNSLQFAARKLGFDDVEKATTSKLYEYLMAQKAEKETVYNFSDKLWKMYIEEKDINYYVIGSKYGKNGDDDVFSLFLEKSVVATGFYGHTNLSDLYLKPKSEIISYLKKQGEATNAYSALKHFLNIKVGDKIAIKADGSPRGKKGYLKIIGFAEVIEKEGVVYQYDKELGHTLNVDYIEAPIGLELSLGGYGRTIHHLSNQNHIQMIFENDNYIIEEEMIPKSSKKPKTHPLNQILFGPPGTGKTYRTRQIAYEIIKGEEPKDNDAAIQLFKDLKGDQIEFVTFHQNYSYEDFVQGLRPDINVKDQLAFERKDGIFKEIATKALYEYYKKSKQEKRPIKQAVQLDFDEVYQVFVEDLKEKENVLFKTSTGSKIHVSGISVKNNIYLKHDTGSREYTVSATRLKKLNNAISDLDKIQNIHQEILDAIGGCNSTVYWVALNEFRKFEKKYQPQTEIPQEEVFEDVKYETMVQNLQNFSSEDFDINRLEVKNYVLIIDEINRANISRVFGELITLLEPSKRFGQAEELEVQLPSGDRFVVPPNLYVIGTMNTADKSIALLDIALRRRFEFVPVFPNRGLVDENYRTFFDALNTKIADWKSPDFTIGHSYFMEITDEAMFEKVMNNKIIPLLSEYFMNDLERVKSLLSHVGVQLKTEYYGILRFESIDLSKTKAKTQSNEND